jgi:hypothetical protein
MCLTKLERYINSNLNKILLAGYLPERSDRRALPPKSAVHFVGLSAMPGPQNFDLMIFFYDIPGKRGVITLRQ